MTSESMDNLSGNVIASIQNRQDPGQTIDLIFLPGEGGFATSGIRTCFDLPEILIPSHLVAEDLNLMGAIVSAILEKISQACEGDGSFEYVSGFRVMGREFTLSPHGDFMKLEAELTSPALAELEVD